MRRTVQNPGWLLNQHAADLRVAVDERVFGFYFSACMQRTTWCSVEHLLSLCWRALYVREGIRFLGARSPSV
jgi:hypothetical protein